MPMSKVIQQLRCILLPEGADLTDRQRGRNAVHVLSQLLRHPTGVITMPPLPSPVSPCRLRVRPPPRITTCYTAIAASTAARPAGAGWSWAASVEVTTL
jgi:hypothetical protein